MILLPTFPFAPLRIQCRWWNVGACASSWQLDCMSNGSLLLLPTLPNAQRQWEPLQGETPVLHCSPISVGIPESWDIKITFYPPIRDSKKIQKTGCICRRYPGGTIGKKMTLPHSVPASLAKWHNTDGKYRWDWAPVLLAQRLGSSCRFILLF